MRAKENISGEKTIANAIVLDLVNTKFKIPPMPANGPKLMSLAKTPIDQIDIDDFVKIIDSDPGLLSLLLQMANSSYFRGVDEICTVRAAIVRLGLQEIIDAVNLYFYQRMFPKIPDIEGFKVKEYWAFSWACAHAARRLGHPNLGMNINSGELYIAGLLHGIGKLILAILYPFEFSKCLETAARLKKPLHLVELDQFGTSDTNISARVLQIWNIPFRVCTGIEFHQNPDTAPEGYKNIAASIQYAYAVASMSGIGKAGDGSVMPLESTWIGRQSGLPLSKKDIQETVVKEILNSIEEKAESFTGISPEEQEMESAPEKGQRQHQGTNNKTESKPPGHKSTDAGSSKTGFFSWIRSLFR